MSETPSLRSQGELFVTLDGTMLHKEPATHWNDARDEYVVEVPIVEESGVPVVTLRVHGGDTTEVANLLRAIADAIT